MRSPSRSPSANTQCPVGSPVPVLRSSKSSLTPCRTEASLTACDGDSAPRARQSLAPSTRSPTFGPGRHSALAGGQSALKAPLFSEGEPEAWRGPEAPSWLLLS